VFPAVREDLFLDFSLQKVVPDLVRDDIRPGQVGPSLFEVSDSKVAHTNSPDLSLSVKLLKSLHSLLERNLLPWIGPVYLVEVYLVDPEPFHASRRSSLKLIVSEIGPVDLGGYYEFVSADVSQGSSHDLFTVSVTVSLGSEIGRASCRERVEVRVGGE